VASRNAAFHDGALARRAAEPAEAGLLAGAGAGRVSCCAPGSLDWTFVFTGLAAAGSIGLRESARRTTSRHGAALAARQGAGAGAVTGAGRTRCTRSCSRPPASTTWGVQFADGRPCRSRTRSCGSYAVAHREAHRGRDGRHPVARACAAGDPGRFLPLLLLLYAVGAADGLTQRAIRRCLRRARVGQPVPPGEVPAGGGAGAGRVAPAGLAGAWCAWELCAG
jgi:hypothetical protein